MKLINQSSRRLTKAFKLLENNNVILMRYPTAVVHSLDEKRIHYVNFVEKTCDCEDIQYNGVKYCQHLYATMIKAGVYYV